jgi:FlaA1/EpsC-like NDP-sugar epimerase
MALINRHRLWQAATDGVLVAIVWYVAFALRFDRGIPPVYDRYWRRTLFLVVFVKVGVLLLSGIYNKWWRYISLRDMQVIARSVALASVVVWVILALVKPEDRRLPIGVAVMDLVLTLVVLAGARVLARSIIERPRPGSIVPSGREILVVGAGDAGGLVLREMLKNRAGGYVPTGLVDDDPRKRHMRLHGVRVLGTTDELPRILRDHRPDEVHIAIPSAAGEVRNRIVRACRDAGVPVKTLPSVHELLHGDAQLVSQLREVQVEDVLGREPVQFDPAQAGRYAAGEIVLVTGAGGSIGSELCRQLVRIGPERLILFDHSEGNLFSIERELVARGVTNIVPVVGDVKDARRLDRLFTDYRPGVVFHAAAYKHVPLMEANPLEAVRNNALATAIVAHAAAMHGVRRFVLVSTDKAVNAQTVMGSSKALAEWVVEAMAERGSDTIFVAVRFGNVLGSSGSVVPIFREQIAQGGPVTVTHPDMTRFFMTIPEAAQLIVQAGGIGEGGEIFVLDMGKPVRILDLARDMITLSGHEPGRDIEIRLVGIRPGEKLDEQLFEDWETVERTTHWKIRRATRPPIDAGWLDGELAALEGMVSDGDVLGVVGRLDRMVRAPERTSPLAPADPARRAAGAPPRG